MKPIEPAKEASHGRKGPPTSPRPPAPPSQSIPREEAPNAEMMAGAENALMSFLMYYYQALRQEGHDVATAKRMMGDKIEALYDQFATHARIDFKPDKLRNPLTLLDEIIQDVKSLGISGKGVHQKLLDFKRLIK